MKYDLQAITQAWEQFRDATGIREIHMNDEDHYQDMLDLLKAIMDAHYPDDHAIMELMDVVATLVESYENAVFTEFPIINVGDTQH